MQKIQGAIGFTIPVQTLTQSNEVTLTPVEVMDWQKRLPADLGQSAKKIYRAICDCNQVFLDPKIRFEILNLFDSSVHYICQALSKHYVNRSNALTTQQLTIAHLAQTLQEQMANGYKLVVEQSVNLQDSTLLPIALQKIIRYFTGVIIISYELYCIPPNGIWKELHLLYQYAEKNALLTKCNLEEEYKRVLILAATYPYQQRQSEQIAVYKATDSWLTKVTLRRDLPNASDPAFLIVDFHQDKPPIFLARDLIKYSSSCKALDVHPLLIHLKKLLAEIEPNELQSRISHHHDPEYAVPSAVLRGIIRGWEIPLTRLYNRTTHDEKVQISIGFLSTHFYLNGLRPFQSQPMHEGTENFTLSFSNFGTDTSALEIGAHNHNRHETFSLTSETKQSTSPYPLYPCRLISKNPNGYGLIWSGNTYPPMQSGEIIGLSIDEQSNTTWEICAIRWLLHLTESEFKIGVERLSKTAKSAAVQLIKDSKPSGYIARCFILENSLLLPAFPFKVENQVILISENNVSTEVTLTQLIDSTGIYNQFQYITKNNGSDKPFSPSQTTPTPDSSTTSQKEPDKGDDIFDSVWSNL